MKIKLLIKVPVKKKNKIIYPKNDLLSTMLKNYVMLKFVQPIVSAFCSLPFQMQYIWLTPLRVVRCL